MFPPFVAPLIPISETATGFPVRRIFCVGQNYAAHAAEMGSFADHSAPFYFTKSPASVQLSGAPLAYPPGTENLHYEMELAVYLGPDGIYGHGCALDMTRRDLQFNAKDKARPWDVGKDWEGSAILAPITPGPIEPQALLELKVNGATRQSSPVSDMIHDIPAILNDLALYYDLDAGDVILTGTPAGVGPVTAGDHLIGTVTGLDPVETNVIAR